MLVYCISAVAAFLEWMKTMQDVRLIKFDFIRANIYIPRLFFFFKLPVEEMIVNSSFKEGRMAEV